MNNINIRFNVSFHQIINYDGPEGHVLADQYVHGWTFKALTVKWCVYMHSNN